MSDPTPVSQRHRVDWPTVSWLLARPERLLAFGFGVGLIRPGSGTWGTLLAWVLWWPLQWALPEPWLTVFVIGSVLAGIWFCEVAARDLGVPDHVGIVWDEIAAMWLLLWVLPEHWAIAVAAFVLFRLFDVAKPTPIRQLDAWVKGGWGVMLDDLVAALYAAALIGVWWYVVWPWWQVK